MVIWAVTLEAFVPSRVAEEGDTTHADAGGAPLQLTDAVPENPPIGFNVTVTDADPPGFRLIDAGEAVTEKSDAGEFTVCNIEADVLPEKVLSPPY